MNVSETLAALDRIESQLRRELPERARASGVSLVSVAQQRVLDTGRDGEGQSFTPYSTAPIPAFFYLGKSRTASAEKKVKQAAKARTPLSYSDFRAINNLNTSPKTFEFTGEMWRGVGVVSVEQIPDGVRIVLGGTTKVSKDRLEWNTAREGKRIIRPSKAEIAAEIKSLNAWAKSVVKQHLP